MAYNQGEKYRKARERMARLTKGCVTPINLNTPLREEEPKMAATIAKAIGFDRTRQKETHRLGHESAWVQAATWRTFITATVMKDGSATVKVTRNGETLLEWHVGGE